MSTSFVVAVFFPPAQFRELHLVYSQGEPRLFALDRIIFYILVLLFDRVTF